MLSRDREASSGSLVSLHSPRAFPFSFCPFPLHPGNPSTWEVKAVRSCLQTDPEGSHVDAVAGLLAFLLISITHD